MTHGTTRGPRSLRVAALLAGLLLASVAAAWSPARFEVYCGTAAGVSAADYRSGAEADDEATEACVGEERRRTMERFAAEILERYSQAAFASPAPTRLGPVVTGRGGDPVVRLYLNTGPETAYAVSPCRRDGSIDISPLTIVSVNPEFVEGASDPLLYYVLAHELFHVVMNAQPVAQQASYCQAPPWLSEGVIDAAATFVTRERFPNYAPPLAEPAARNLYGLRRYSDNFLTEQPEVAAYRTSALWHHLAEASRQDLLDLLASYHRVALPAGGDWLLWLDERLESDPRVREGLWQVLPQFFTDFATWGQRKHAAAVGDQRWLGAAFDGCSGIPLSPRQPTRSLTIDLERLAAHCLRVVVGGLEPNQLASVKLMVIDPDVDALDRLHLGLAAAPGPLHIDGMDRLSYDCFDELRRWSHPLGCLRMPFVGEREDARGGGFAKTWDGFGHRADERGQLEQRYVLSSVPLVPAQRRDAAARPQSVRLTVSLETATLATPSVHDRGDTTVGTAGLRASRSTLDAGKSRVPMVMSELDAANPMHMPEVLDLVMLEARPMIEHLPGYLDGVTVVLGEVNPEHDGDLFPSWRLDRRYLLTLYFDPELAGGAPVYGAAGSYAAWVGGVAEGGGPLAPGLALPGLGMIGLCNYPDPDPRQPSTAEPAARVEVVAFDEALLHLRFEGVFGFLRENERGDRVCADPQPFDGELIAPFGWLYAGDGFGSIVTPGIEADRAVRYATMREVIGLPVRPPADTGAGGGPGGGPGGGALEAVPECDCSCEALVGFGDVMAELGDLDPDALDPAAAEVFACIDVCGMPRLMQCLMQPGP